MAPRACVRVYARVLAGAAESLCTYILYRMLWLYQIYRKLNCFRNDVLCCEPIVYSQGWGGKGYTLRIGYVSSCERVILNGSHVTKYLYIS